MTTTRHRLSGLALLPIWKACFCLYETGRRATKRFPAESVEGGAYAGVIFIGIKPDLIWRCQGNQAEINRRALEGSSRFQPEEAGTLDSWGLLAESRIDLPAQVPPMAAGLLAI